MSAIYRRIVALPILDLRAWVSPLCSAKGTVASCTRGFSSTPATATATQLLVPASLSTIPLFPYLILNLLEIVYLISNF